MPPPCHTGMEDSIAQHHLCQQTFTLQFILGNSTWGSAVNGCSSLATGHLSPVSYPAAVTWKKSRAQLLPQPQAGSYGSHLTLGCPWLDLRVPKPQPHASSRGCVGLDVTWRHAPRCQQGDTLMLLLSARQAVPTQPVSRHQGRRRIGRAGMKCHTPPCAAKGRLGARTGR